jgi:hypothetical protein
MTRDQMFAPLDPGDAAGSLDTLDIDAKDALTPPRLNQRFPLGFFQPAITSDGSLDLPFPLIERGLRRRTDLLRTMYRASDIRNFARFPPDEPKDNRCECRAHACEVDALQAVAIGTERRIFRGQVAANLFEMIFWPDPVRNFSEAGIDLPADRLPVIADPTEFSGLGALITVRARDP